MQDKIAVNGTSRGLLNNEQKYKCATQRCEIVVMQPGSKKITALLVPFIGILMQRGSIRPGLKENNY